MQRSPTVDKFGPKKNQGMPNDAPPARIGVPKSQAVKDAAAGSGHNHNVRSCKIQ